MKLHPISRLRSTHLKEIIKTDIDYELPVMAILLSSVIILMLLLTI